MGFEWDEQKREVNLDKHGIDFVLAQRIFDNPVLESTDNRRDYSEQRWSAYGEADGVVLFVIYTWRGNIRRLISARKAGTDEKKMYVARLAVIKRDS